MTDNYCIRHDYIARNEALTVEKNPQDYWTEERIRMSAQYQFYVYKATASLLTKRPKGARAVADIGCGYPEKANKLLKPSADSIVLYDQPTLQQLTTERFPDMCFKPIDLEDPQDSTEQFDVTVCSDVIEHLLEPDACLRFLQQITKPDGLIVLSTPERDILRGRDCLTSEKPEHVREWNKSEFGAYLRSRGFNIKTHSLLPEARLNLRGKVSRALFGRLLSKRRNWFGCQMAVCTSSS